MTVRDLRMMLDGLEDGLPVMIDAYEYGLLELKPKSISTRLVWLNANVDHTLVSIPRFGVVPMEYDERCAGPAPERSVVKALVLARRHSAAPVPCLPDFAGPHEYADEDNDADR